MLSKKKVIKYGGCISFCKQKLYQTIKVFATNTLTHSDIGNNILKLKIEIFNSNYKFSNLVFGQFQKVLLRIAIYIPFSHRPRRTNSFTAIGRNQFYSGGHWGWRLRHVCPIAPVLWWEQTGLRPGVRIKSRM